LYKLPPQLTIRSFSDHGLINYKDDNAFLKHLLSPLEQKTKDFCSGIFCRRRRVSSKDEETLKTPIPECRLYWSILFGVV
jgi:hypothetical protein